MKIKRIGLLFALALMVFQAHAEERVAAPLPTEEEAIATLQSDAGWEAKHMACRALRQIGSAKAVPALAALLLDDTLSHMACFALEPMAFPEAGAALRAALPEASGAAQAGIAATLGARQDTASVDALAGLVAASDPMVAHAAAGALGRIASDAAIESLLNARGGSAGIAIDEALLAAAQRRIAAGDHAVAAEISAALLVSDGPVHVRLGAFRLHAFAQPDAAPTQMIAALAGDQPAFRDMAGQIVAETTGTAATRAYAKALADLPVAGQAPLLRGLGDRGDAAARKAVLAMLESPDATVQLAALHAAGKLGKPSDVGTIAAFLDPPDTAEASAAAAALRGMPGGSADAELAAAFAQVSPGVQAGILSVLTDRMAPEAVTLAVAQASAAAVEVRHAALNALLQLAGPAEMPVVIAALQSAEDNAERALAAKVLNTVAGHHKDAVLPLILDAEAQASDEVQGILLRALGYVGTPAALDAVVARLDDAEARGEAVKVLAGWSTRDAAPELLTLVKSGDADVQDAAFEGYVRLARGVQEIPVKEEMLDTAMALAPRKEMKWKVLSVWATVATGKSMSTLLPYLDDPEVEREAATAVIEVARQIATHSDEARNWARECLQAVIDKTSSESIRGRAGAQLEKIS